MLLVMNRSAQRPSFVTAAHRKIIKFTLSDVCLCVYDLLDINH